MQIFYFFLIYLGAACIEPFPGRVVQFSTGGCPALQLTRRPRLQWGLCPGCTRVGRDSRPLRRAAPEASQILHSAVRMAWAFSQFSAQGVLPYRTQLRLRVSCVTFRGVADGRCVERQGLDFRPPPEVPSPRFPAAFRPPPICHMRAVGKASLLSSSCQSPSFAPLGLF